MTPSYNRYIVVVNNCYMAIMKKPGPPKEYPETMLVQLPEGAKAKVREVLENGETLSRFARDAILERAAKRAKRRTKGRAHGS